MTPVTTLLKPNVNRRSHLWGFHVQDFGDSPLHDEEMGVVHIKLDRSKQVLDAVVLDVGPVDEVLVLASDDNLTRDRNLQGKSHCKIERAVVLVYSRVFTSSWCSYPSGLCFLSLLSNVTVTVALVIPA